MENLTIFQFNKDLTVKDNLKSFFTFKKQILDLEKRIEKFESIYDEEIEELKSEIHVSKSGDIYFISEMEDSHLINTVNLLLENKTLKSKIVKKYLKEIKKRGLVEKIDINKSKEKETEFKDFEEFYNYQDDPFWD